MKNSVAWHFWHVIFVHFFFLHVTSTTECKVFIILLWLFINGLFSCAINSIRLNAHAIDLMNSTMVCILFTHLPHSHSLIPFFTMIVYPNSVNDRPERDHIYWITIITICFGCVECFWYFYGHTKNYEILSRKSMGPYKTITCIDFNLDWLWICRIENKRREGLHDTARKHTHPSHKFKRLLNAQTRCQNDFKQLVKRRENEKWMKKLKEPIHTQIHLVDSTPNSSCSPQSNIVCECWRRVLFRFIFCFCFGWFSEICVYMSNCCV